MWVERVHLENYRGFRGKVEIALPRDLAVICGANGAGKSSVLEAISSLLAAAPFLIGGQQAVPPPAGSQNTSNISAGESLALWMVSLMREDEDLGTFAAEAQLGDLPGSRYFEHTTRERLPALRSDKLHEPNHPPLPALGFIHSGSTRAGWALDQKLLAREPRLAGYLGAFDSEARQFVGLERWYEQEENLENQRKIDRGNLTYREPSLEAVRRAIRTFLGNLHTAELDDLRVVRAHKSTPLDPASGRLTIKKGDQTLFIDQLSDGERRLVLLVADTARRMVILNPDLEDPLQTPGILAVDEIELHLHPVWQRRVVPALRAAFPKLQLILTTHSPQVLASVPNESVIVLGDGKVLSNGAQVHGRDSNTILTEVMGDAERPAETQARLDHLFDLLEPQPDAAQEELTKLEAELGPDDPDLVRARAMLTLMAG
ncbi:MAG: AAA family ATPase [Myxococcales bacterium]|nr:AAA family ATPase [Myxococcales bacterium]